MGMRRDIYINRVSWSRIGSWKSSKYLALTKYLSWKEQSLQGEKEEIRRWLYVTEFTSSCCCTIGICSELEFWKLGRVSQHCSVLCRWTSCIAEVLEMRVGLKGWEIRIHKLLILPESLAGTLELLAEKCFGRTQLRASLVEIPQHRQREDSLGCVLSHFSATLVPIRWCKMATQEFSIRWGKFALGWLYSG